MEMIGDRIRKAREMKDMTQAQLAKLMNVSRVSVTQWELNQTQPHPDRYQLLTEVLGGSMEWYLSGDGQLPISDRLKRKVQADVEASNARIGAKISEAGPMIPVFGQAVGGVDGEFSMNGSVLYEVMAPPVISSISGAYAVAVSGDSMSPRYEDGEICFVDPRRRVKKGDYVIAQVCVDDDSPPLAYVKKFLRHNSDELVLEQFNPAKELRFPSSSVRSVHYIALAGNA